ncbi:T9SS type A sorting domain-containing protein [Maribacter sp. 2308TA10-17]|uniref:T9SS type A sorting domain-containing protein n=1 Tax=Maribacter sp. 2308TA10-17 TaxID=3386276 RepID=UPI0039BC9B24
MKKFYFIFSLFVLLFFYGMDANAQHEYKIEFQIEVYFRNSSAFDYNFRLANFSGDSSGPSLFRGNVVVGPIETSFNQEDYIISTSTNYLGINRDISGWNQFYDFCSVPLGRDILNDGDSFASYFNVYKILPFSTVNGYSATNNTLSECQSSSLMVHSDSCGTASYAVQYQVGGSAVWSTLLAYGRRSSSFSFQKNDFPGLDNFENLRLRLQYNNTGTIEYSDVLTYSYLPCPPVLNNTIPIDVSCSDSDDGSAKLNFDRALDSGSGEEFRATLSGITPEGFAIPEADVIVTNFAADNSYTFSNIEAGTYTITYQTFFDDGMGNMVPSSTGETGNFAINRPSVVTVSEVSTSQPVCPGDTGSVTLTANGGTATNYEYSVNNGTWQNSATFNNLTPGSYTFRSRITVAGGVECISPTPIDVTINAVTNPLIIEFAQESDMASYPGATDGSIAVRISGGSGPYSYSISGPTPDTGSLSIGTNIIPDLQNGSYTLTVTDSNPCSVNFPTSIVVSAVEVPSVVSANITNEISCFGDSDGVIAMSISGGQTPYQYAWRRNGTAISGSGSSLSGLNAGTYELTVASAGGDLSIPASTVSRSIVLNNPTQLSITSATTNAISCFGGNDGSIDVTVNGGTAPYRYRIANSGGFTNLDASGNIPITVAGNYPLFIRDANDCEVSYSGTLSIIEPPAITLSEVVASHVDNTINAGTTGELEVAIANNIGTTTYNWTRNGTAFTPPAGSTNTRLINLPAGDYGLTVIDGNGCSASLAAPIIITEPGPLGITSLTNGKIDVSCKGEATGAITATVTGTPPFNFVWERQGDPGFSAPNQATITGLEAGTYTLRLTDATPTPEVTLDVTITEPALALNATALPTDVSCFGGTNGSILVNATGGTAPYTYSLNGGAFQASNTFTDLTPASYSIDVRDFNGCGFGTTALIGEPDELIVTLDLDNTTDVSVSGGSDGALAISIAGGTMPYDITWTGPSFSSTSEDITGLIAGTYTLVVRDANHTTDSGGCYLIQSFSVSEPGPLSIDTIIATDVECKGDATGGIVATVSGNAPITYTWSIGGSVITGADTNTLQNIVAGTYTLTVSDASANPPESINIVVDEPLEALDATGAAFDVTCNGANDGSVQINATGGTPPYTYSLDGGAFGTSNTFTDLIAGSYPAVVRDLNNCEFILPNPITVVQPQEMGLDIDQQTSLSAAGANDGAIAILPFGGTPPYNFIWTADNGFTSSDEDISNLAGGTYTLVIQDANYNTAVDTGCTYTQSFVIAEPGVLLASITQSVFLECKDDAFAELITNVQGGVSFPDGSYTYEWFQVNGGSNTLLTETSDIIADLGAGEYFVRVTDANSISVDASSIVVTEPDRLSIVLEGKTDILCQGLATGAIDVSITGGTPPYQYSWNNTSTTQDLTDIPSGDYTLDVVDANGCITDIDVNIAEPLDPLTIDNVAQTDASAYLAADGSITLTLSGGTLPYTIAWTRDSDNSNAGSTAGITNLAADFYTVSITDANGCNLTETYQINQPDIVEETLVNPICTGEANGSISLLVNEGNGTFTYQWSNGATTDTITDLLAGSYSVTVTGLPNGPVERTYILEDPEPLSVELGENRTLCLDQSIELDVTAADPASTYLWSADNGFTSTQSIVTITDQGIYSVSVTSPSGCTATGSITINTSSEEIGAELVMSSQAFTGEPVYAVDTSNPRPDSISWILPTEATVINQNQDEAEMVFDTPGEYEVTLITQKGNCSESQTKTVIIVERDASVSTDSKNDTQPIGDFILYPNPTSGQFTAQVDLPERGNIAIKIFSFANNQMIASKKDRGTDNYLMEFDISGTPPGVYAVLLETEQGNTLRKIIVR